MHPKKMKIRITFNMPIPALFVLLCSFIAADSYTLSFKLLPGEVFRLNVYSSQQIKQTMMGKDQITNNETRIDYIFRILNGNREEYLLDMQLDSIWIRMNISEEKVEGTSSINQSKPGMLSRSLSVISKKHLKVHLTPTGDITSVTDPDTLFHAVIDGYKQVPEQVKTALKEALDQRFGTDAFQIELQNILAIYSSKSVKLGSHWQTTVPLSAGLPGMTQNTWTLNNLSGGEFNISAEGKIEPPAKNDFQKFNGILMKYELNGNKLTHYRVDDMNGWIHTASIKEEIIGMVRMQGSPAIPEGIYWPISIQWTMECIGSRLR
jgi:hypothetical protein